MWMLNFSIGPTVTLEMSTPRSLQVTLFSTELSGSFTGFFT